MCEAISFSWKYDSWCTQYWLLSASVTDWSQYTFASHSLYMLPCYSIHVLCQLIFVDSFAKWELCTSGTYMMILVLTMNPTECFIFHLISFLILITGWPVSIMIYVELDITPLVRKLKFYIMKQGILKSSVVVHRDL